MVLLCFELIYISKENCFSVTGSDFVYYWNPSISKFEMVFLGLNCWLTYSKSWPLTKSDENELLAKEENGVFRRRYNFELEYAEPSLHKCTEGKPS